MSEGKTAAKGGSTFPLMRRLTRPQMLGRLLFVLVCLATLVGLFYLAENWRGNRAWAKKQQQLEARGISVDWETHVPPPVADEQNFALTAFFRPLFDFKPGTQEWRDTNAYNQVNDFAKDFDSNEGLGRWMTAKRTDFNLWLASYHGRTTVTGNSGETGSSNPATDVMTLLQVCDPVLTELREASQRTQARFPVRYEEENLFAILLPHLGVLNRVGRVLQLRALAQLELGRTEDALDDLLLLFDIGETLAGEPFLISQLVRHAIYRSGTSVLWEGLAERQWSAGQLRRLEARLGKAGFLPQFQRSVLAEHAAGHRMIELVRKDPGAADWLDDATGNSALTDMSRWFRLAPDGWFGFEHVSYATALTAWPFDQLDLPGGDVAAIDRHSHWVDDCGDRASILNHQVMVSILAPALNKAALRAKHTEVSTSLATIGCALERYRLAKGQLPNDLAALTPDIQSELLNDSFSGEALKYRLTSDGQYALYSVGWNQTDDGGVTDERASDGISDKGDWVWRFPEGNP